jgi:hypothetical protein
VLVRVGGWVLILVAVVIIRVVPLRKRVQISKVHSKKGAGKQTTPYFYIFIKKYFFIAPALIIYVVFAACAHSIYVNPTLPTTIPTTKKELNCITMRG